MINNLLKNKYGEVPPGQEEIPEPGTLIIDDELLRKGFTAIPNLILEDTSISISARFTYIILLSFAWQQGNCFPGQQRIANRLGVHKRSIIRFLQELEERKYIARQRRGLGKTNIYHILKVRVSGRKAEVTPLSFQEVTPIATQEVTPVSLKEYSVRKDTEEKDSDLSKFRKVETRKKNSKEPYSEQIAQVIDGLSKHELNDPTHLNSNITQAQNLWRNLKSSEGDFVLLIQEARKRTMEHSGLIRKATDGGRGAKNCAPYFFKVLKVLSRERMLANFRRGFKSPP